MIDFNKTALVLVDLQKGITALEGAPHRSDTVVQNAKEMIELFRNNNGFIAFVRVAFHDGKDELKPNAQVNLPNSNAEDFSDFDPRLGKLDNDYVVSKRHFSAFFGTDLDLQLRRRGIDTIVIGGISTHIGVDTTARDAYQYNYEQYFITDMMTAPKKSLHEFSVQNIFPIMGQLLTTKEFIQDNSSTSSS